MTALHETLLQIIHWAKSERLDPAAAVQEYFAEKDSRLTLSEAGRWIARLESEHASTCCS
jgi:hypothetical protein